MWGAGGWIEDIEDIEEERFLTPKKFKSCSIWRILYSRQNKSHFMANGTKVVAWSKRSRVQNKLDAHLLLNISCFFSVYLVTCSPHGNFCLISCSFFFVCSLVHFVSLQSFTFIGFYYNCSLNNPLLVSWFTFVSLYTKLPWWISSHINSMLGWFSLNFKGCIYLKIICCGGKLQPYCFLSSSLIFNIQSNGV